MTEETITFERLIELETDFIKRTVEKGFEIKLQINIFKGNECMPVLLVGKEFRELTHFAIMRAKQIDADFITLFNEGYTTIMGTDRKEMENYMHGDLEKRFKSGDKNVIEVVNLQVMSKEKKKSIIFKKENNTVTKLLETEHFGGYMSL